jgi:predicted dehydrogenase
MSQDSTRRTVLQAASLAYTTNLFTGQVRGANDKVNAAFIGMGRMGRGNLNSAMRQDNLHVSAVCDVYTPNLDLAAEQSAKQPGGAARKIRDFREILADKSVDIVCISTPDHWHAYMTVEACKAGKDVYVEKPSSVTIEEGQKMVQAARKYKRVVQGGTMQRSGAHFIEACNIVKRGDIGEVTVVKTWNYGNNKPEGAPKRPFNANRFGVDPKAFSHFRWFWDYAGGMMTDWGVHVLDIARMGMGEPMPKSVVALGDKYQIKDNRETPDTLTAVYEFPGFLAHYENRMFNGNSMFKQSYGTLFHGTKASLFVDRSLYRIHPEGPGEVVEVKSSNNASLAHWANFLACVKSREKPASDIEICHKSTATCLLANVALRSKVKVDWDDARQTVLQPEARKLLKRDERGPWKINV